MNRDDFLKNVKNGLSAAYFPDARAERPASLPLANFDPAALVEQFSAEVTALQGNVTRANSPADVLAKIISLFAEYDAQAYLAWADEHLPVPNLRAQLAEHGFSAHPLDVPTAPSARRETLSAASGIQIGITGAMAGLADTGTLVVPSGSGKGRFASLLPPVHIALLRIADLYPSLMYFIAAHPNAARDVANLNFISGPSRTADIEQTLTLGVHGPKFVHVILLAER